MNEQEHSETPQGSPNIIVCPGCLEEQVEGPHFCVKCGAPLTVFSTIGPLERILAQGHAYRRATSGPTSRIVVIGMWLIALPQLLILFMFAPATSFSSPDEAAGFGLLVVLALAYMFLLYRVTQNYIIQRKSKGTSNR